MLERARASLVFALIVGAAQAGCLLVLALAGLLPELKGARREGLKPLLQVVSFVALLAIPVVLHDRLAHTRWASTTSRQPTIVTSLAGLLTGFLAGGLLAENGYVDSWMMATRIGAVLGSIVGLFVLNLASSGS